MMPMNLLDINLETRSGKKLSKCLGPFCASCGECFHHCREKVFTFKYPEDARPERIIWLVKSGKPIVNVKKAG